MVNDVTNFVKYTIETWRSDLKCFLILFFNMSAKVQQECEVGPQQQQV